MNTRFVIRTQYKEHILVTYEYFYVILKCTCQKHRFQIRATYLKGGGVPHRPFLFSMSSTLYGMGFGFFFNSISFLILFLKAIFRFRLRVICRARSNIAVVWSSAYCWTSGILMLLPAANLSWADGMSRSRFAIWELAGWANGFLAKLAKADLSITSSLLSAGGWSRILLIIQFGETLPTIPTMSTMFRPRSYWSSRIAICFFGFFFRDANCKHTEDAHQTNAQPLTVRRKARRW